MRKSTRKNKQNQKPVFYRNLRIFKLSNSLLFQMKTIIEKIKTVDGRLINKTYIIEKKIGQGSFSKCYKVKHSNGRVFALKIIDKKQSQLLQNLRLVQQIRIHQSLIHENIVQLDHWYEQDSCKYIFLEYCANGNLQQLCKKRNLQQEQLKAYAKQMLNAIRYLHSQNILHRDLKLSNFFVDENNQIKLGDFGFACRLSQNQLKRQPCGTFFNISPQIANQQGYSFPSDIWTIGTLLYKMKFGQEAFFAKTAKQTLDLLRHAQYRFPNGIKVSENFRCLINSLLIINVQKRLTINQVLDHAWFKLKDKNQVKQKSFSQKIINFFSMSKQKVWRKQPQSDIRDLKNILKQKISNRTQITQKNDIKGNTKIEVVQLVYQKKVSNDILVPNPEISKLFDTILFKIDKQQKQYIFCYFTNGYRQILTTRQYFIINDSGQIFNNQGTRLEDVSKIIKYLVANQLKPNPYKESGKIDFLIQKNKFIKFFTKVDSSYFFSFSQKTHILQFQKQSLIYIYTKQRDLLYNQELKIIKDSTLLSRYRYRMVQYLEKPKNNYRKLMD